MRLNRSGRTLKITTSMLVQSSCGISRPFGDEGKLHDYLARGQLTPLRRRLEADAKWLLAIHEYGKLHGCVRLRWGFLDEMFPAPWHHRDEPTLYELMRQARSVGIGIEAVTGAAPGWERPWSRARHLDVAQGTFEHELVLVDEGGYVIDRRDVQLARIEQEIH